MIVDAFTVRVELVEGRGETFWPRPGRVFVVAGDHTFAELAEAIDTAFGRWDRAHLSEFRRADGVIDVEESGDVEVGTLALGERFVYVFDFGDDWRHVCEVGERVDAREVLGGEPGVPLPVMGWGVLPDQYGRRFEDDDGDTSPPPDPEGADLPAFFWDD